MFTFWHWAIIVCWRDTEVLGSNKWQKWMYLCPRMDAVSWQNQTSHRTLWHRGLNSDRDTALCSRSTQEPPCLAYNYKGGTSLGSWPFNLEIQIELHFGRNARRKAQIGGQQVRKTQDKRVSLRKWDILNCRKEQFSKDLTANHSFMHSTCDMLPQQAWPVDQSILKQLKHSLRPPLSRAL